MQSFLEYYFTNSYFLLTKPNAFASSEFQLERIFLEEKPIGQYRILVKFFIKNEIIDFKFRTFQKYLFAHHAVITFQISGHVLDAIEKKLQ
jgi:hypothetical protein